MRYGFVIPLWDILVLPDLAAEAEAVGWDGIFIPDCILIDVPQAPAQSAYDPWVALTAMALRTTHIRLGTMITPLSRRRPWKVARETTSLDILAHGRLVLPVGLGALDDAGFGRVGEATNRKIRAELLDESLAIINGLWSGERFSYSGTHYQVQDFIFQPTPVQRPRIPIWVVGAWPHPKSLARALRWDGIIPSKLFADGTHATMEPDDIRTLHAYITANRHDATPYDIIVEGCTPGDDRAADYATVAPYEEAGATWWNESMWLAPNAENDVRTRIRKGPPRGI